MDTDKQLLYMGVLTGWLLTTMVMTLVGQITGVPELKLVLMILIGVGVLFGLSSIVELICFFNNFKIVRRD